MDVVRTSSEVSSSLSSRLGANLLLARFPYEPPKNGKLPLAYNHKSGYKDGLDLGPALYALESDAELAKGGGSKRNFPRNLMIKSKYLEMLGISRPPFVPRKRFQPPTLW